MKTSKIDFTLLIKSKVDTLTRCFQNFNTTPNSQDTDYSWRGNFSNLRAENGWKCHKTHNRPLPWQQMSKRLNLFILFMCTQRPFTSQVISKIYLFTFASHIEILPETTINYIICISKVLTINMNHALTLNWSRYCALPLVVKRASLWTLTQRTHFQKDSFFDQTRWISRLL